MGSANAAWLARPDRLFLVAGLVSGLVLALVTPPFQTPDEPAHFFHAYAVSEGRLHALHAGGRIGDVLPASLERVAVGAVDGVPFFPERKVDRQKIAALRQVPLEPERRLFLDFPGSAQSSFVPYLPQAAGILAGRLAGVRPLALLTCARLANLVVSTLLIVLAVRQTPAFRWLTATAASLPMSVFLRASASADALTIAVAYLLVATAAKLAWGEEGEIRRWDGPLLLAVSIAGCLVKPVYFPLVLLALTIPRRRFPAGRRAFSLVVLFALCGLAAAYALRLGGAMDIILRPDVSVDPAHQMHDVLTGPLRFAWIAGVDYVVHLPLYGFQMVGNLGWLDVPLPKVFVFACVVLLAALLLVDASARIRLEPWHRLVLAAALLPIFGMISGSQYVVWTPYRADFIDGIQGRYFLPILTAGAWLLHARRFGGKVDDARLGLWFALGSAVSLAVSAISLAMRYYG